VHMKPELTKLSKKNFHKKIKGERANISLHIWNVDRCDKCCYIGKLCEESFNDSNEAKSYILRRNIQAYQIQNVTS
jgi:hypothetical protein